MKNIIKGIKAGISLYLLAMTSVVCWIFDAFDYVRGARRKPTGLDVFVCWMYEVNANNWKELF